MVRFENGGEPATRPVTLTLRAIMQGFCALMPVALFSAPFGIAFGAAAAEQGLPVAVTIAMSVMIFSGAGQFAALDFLGRDIAYLSLTLIVLAVSARLIVMGAVLSPWINRLPLARRLVVLGWLSDLNFAGSQPALRAGAGDLGHLLGGGLALWLNWIVGTAVGVLAGRSIGDVAVYGLDVVMLCFFAASAAGSLRRRGAIGPIVVASLTAVATLSFLPTGWNIVAAALAGGAISVLIRAE